MNPNEVALWTLAGIGVLALLAVAQSKTGDQIVPLIQTDEAINGLNFSQSVNLNTNSMALDMSHHIHGYHPGYDPDPTAQPVMNTPHRYPAVPGGNLSNVLHHGWDGMRQRTPAGNDWFNTPPEAAVL